MLKEEFDYMMKLLRREISRLKRTRRLDEKK